MHNSNHDELFFASKYVDGLKEEIKAVVEPQVPVTVDRAALIAKIQQRTLERGKMKHQRAPPFNRNQQPKADTLVQQTNYNLQRIRQLRDYRKANNLCYACGEKYEPGHQEVCSKRQKPQVNALAINDLDKEEITEDMLNQLAIEDTLTQDFCQLSLNALSSKDTDNSIKLKALVNSKIMLILLDSGSSHSFINSDFVSVAQLPTVPIPPKKVKLPNGQWLTATAQVKDLQWYIQGHTLSSDMIVLDMGPYDAILGYDWLKLHSPMECDWNLKTLKFCLHGQQVKIQGLLNPPLQATPISATQVVHAAQGNDTWAYVIVDSECSVTHPVTASPIPSEIQSVIQKHQAVFQDPKTLPPTRSYDHAIPLLPDAVPVNARPYHYSPQHKTEIETQVKQLLEAGLITHSHSPFASPVLLVKKKDSTWRFCVDYRKLNDLTIKNRFPMPVIEEILDELAGAEYFTKLDMRAGYHQVRMLPEDEYKTAFKTHHGHYQFKIMPFGLTNAPATFQCIMNQVLRPFLRKFVMLFLDDILIYSNSLEEHAQHLQLVLQALLDNQLYLKQSKCSFAQHQLEYLGHIISADGVATDPQKITAMLHWPQPTTMTEQFFWV
jgi:hypothetical protein